MKSDRAAKLTDLELLAQDRERWKRLAQYLCYKRGHGPHPIYGRPEQCGTCEGKTMKFVHDQEGA